jgi:hypothetical protein
VKRKTLAIGVLVAALFLFALYLSRNSSTPPSQEPLATLTAANFASFETAFDKSMEGPRLVLLLSPT